MRVKKIGAILVGISSFVSGGLLFGRKKKRNPQKYKLTEEDLYNLNWGNIEKKIGIDASIEPSQDIKLKIIEDSIFAREFKWFTNEDIEKHKKKRKKILECFNDTLSQ